MHQARVLAVLATVFIAGGVTTGDAAGQSSKAGPRAAPAHACDLLSAAEIRRATGDERYEDGMEGDAPGEGIGGGSSCMYDGAVGMVAFVLISGRDPGQTIRGGKLAEGCSRETVGGVGDDAYFVSCPAKPVKHEAGPLYLKVGSNELIVDMINIEPPATEAYGKRIVIAVAKAATAKLR